MSKPRTDDRLIVRTPFTKQKRGSFTMILSNGHKKRFKDVAHRDAAIEGAMHGRFKDRGELTDFFKKCPNGFDSFIPSKE